jgi:hypothetical protein
MKVGFFPGTVEESATKIARDPTLFQPSQERRDTGSAKNRIMQERIAFKQQHAQCKECGGCMNCGKPPLKISNTNSHNHTHTTTR